MSKVLKHCYPDRKLDLDELRIVLNELETNSGSHGGSSGGSPTSSSRGKLMDSNFTGASANGQSVAQEGVPLEEIASLHADLGCMMRDSTGLYRYIGADSGISFNAAVRSLHPDSIASKVDKDIIPGMKTTSMPPASPESTPGSVPYGEIQLPARDVCFRYVSQYFDEVHCLYWLYSSEQFHTRLEQTYSYPAPSAASWICSLYAIIAMGSLNSKDPSNSIHNRSSGEWLALAKGLVSRVCDEADLDSVRALILLASSIRTVIHVPIANIHRPLRYKAIASQIVHIFMQVLLSGLAFLLASMLTNIHCRMAMSRKNMLDVFGGRCISMIKKSHYALGNRPRLRPTDHRGNHHFPLNMCSAQARTTHQDILRCPLVSLI
jgi:hypothetical protein